MSNPAATGRFWICPQCHKHVPMRIDACACGFDRTTVPVKMREAQVGHREAEVPSSGGGFKSFALGALCMGLLAVGFLAWNRQPAPDSQPARRFVWEQPPQVVQNQPPQVVIVQPSQPPTLAEATAGGGGQPPQQVIRIEVPQSGDAHHSLPTPPANTAELDAQRQAAETQWLMQRGQVEARLKSAFVAFQQALCREMSGGVPLTQGAKNFDDYRNDYVSAKFQAAAFVESARGDVPSFVESERRPRTVYATACCWSSVPS
jgi:hypothetical protein